MLDHVKEAGPWHEVIRRALIEKWDPIGIRKIPEAHDEYDLYIAPVYELLAAQCSKSELFDYLWRVETERMGLCGNSLATEIFTESLLDLWADQQSFLK
jgi:uncharacterized protein YeaO (DUF488 family)